MRNLRFTFIVDAHERRMIEALSERLARTRSDTLRLLVREAARQIEQQEEHAGAGVLDASADR